MQNDEKPKTFESIMQVLERLSKESKFRASQPVQEPVKAEILHLPVEYQHQRAAPNICLRSALFSVVKRGRRKYVKNHPITAQNGYEITFTGDQLDQSDQNVWLAVKHLCFQYPLGVEVAFHATEIFHLLQQKRSSYNYKWLKSSLERMKNCSVGMRYGSVGFLGNMIDWYAWDDDTNELKVILSPKMGPLFADDAYTLLNAPERLLLKRELSLWLHGYWSSHKQTYPIYAGTLIELCGGDVTENFKINQEIRNALVELEQIGFIKSGWMVNRNGLVKVEKSPKTIIYEEENPALDV